MYVHVSICMGLYVTILRSPSDCFATVPQKPLPTVIGCRVQEDHRHAPTTPRIRRAPLRTCQGMCPSTFFRHPCPTPRPDFALLAFVSMCGYVGDKMYHWAILADQDNKRHGIYCTWFLQGHAHTYAHTCNTCTYLHDSEDGCSSPRTVRAALLWFGRLFESLFLSTETRTECHYFWAGLTTFIKYIHIHAHTCIYMHIYSWYMHIHSVWCRYLQYTQVCACMLYLHVSLCIHMYAHVWRYVHVCAYVWACM
jgi:hypothetical protein